MSVAIHPEAILKDLRKLWADLGKQQSSGVLRACSMTLIVVVDESENTMDIGETIALLMHEHPSRAIVLRVRSSDVAHLEARVFAQCWMPFGRRQQICCEQVEILASNASLAGLRPVLLGIMAPDLPVVVYCPSVRLWETQCFNLLLPIADKLIVDSRDSPDAPWMLLRTKAAAPKTLRPADLAWARLTPWREAVANLFETPENRRAIYSLENVNILYTGQPEPSSVYYLAGWFMHVLGAGVHLNVAPGVGPSYASIARVDLHGPSFEATLDLIDESSVELRQNGTRQRIVFPPLSDYHVLRQELAILGRDSVFEDVLGLANLMRGKS